MTKMRAEQYRVVSWNLNHGGNEDEQWRFLLDELEPDLALLQEVRQPPGVGCRPRRSFPHG
jgi:hypothetical protein